MTKKLIAIKLINENYPQLKSIVSEKIISQKSNKQISSLVIKENERYYNFMTRNYLR